MLFEYLSGRSNPLTKQLIIKWISNPQNTRTFHEWLLLYEIQNPLFVPDQEKGLGTILERIDAKL